jgi:hypothetical protein
MVDALLTPAARNWLSSAVTTAVAGKTPAVMSQAADLATAAR